MNLLKDPIEVLERLDYRPKRAEVPSSVFALNATLGDLYEYGLRLDKPEECEWHLRWLVIHNLHHRIVRTETGERGMTLIEAFKEERTELWFFALALDLRFGCYRVIEVLPGLNSTCAGIPNARWRTVEYQQWRRKAKALYGCVAPRLESKPEPLLPAPRPRSAARSSQRTNQQADLFGENTWRSSI